MPLRWWACTIFVWLSALVGSHVLRILALENGAWLDHPNERSSHEKPTPRGGGLAIAAAFLWALLAWTVHQGFSWPLAGLFVGSAAVAAIGWRDDLRGCRVSTRLLVHFAAAALFLFSLRGVPHSGWAWLDSLSPLVFSGIALVGLVWTLNLYNFMDGIDGLATVQGLCAAGSMALLAQLRSDLPLASISLWLAVACLGFLPLNWAPAKQFMGDVGSGFLGFAIAALGLWGALRGTWSVAVPLLLLSPFYADATWTLLQRLLRGAKIQQAHRSHAYQHAARRWGHARVSASVGLFCVVWALPLAGLSLRWPALTLLWLVLGYAPLGYAAWKFKAGQ